jgi:hypothetical protein
MTNTLSSNPYERIFTAQKALFRTGATRAREWRLDQLARMERMVSENEAELQDAVKSDQNRLPGIRLRDTGRDRRSRLPAQPARRLDEARRGARPEPTGRDRAPRSDISRSLRRRPHHRSVQRPAALLHPHPSIRRRRDSAQVIGSDTTPDAYFEQFERDQWRRPQASPLHGSWSY